MLRSWNRMRYGMFDRAINKNIVTEPKWSARLNRAWIRMALNQPVPMSGIPNKLRYEKPEQNPRTQQYWENTHGLLVAPQGTIPWVVELARYSVPLYSVSVIKSFEQFVNVDESPLTLNQYWGNPYILPQYLNITWYFRLERSDIGGEPAWINVSTINPNLPGEPHFSVSEFHDIWFPAASQPSQNFHMTVGGGYRLRVIAVLERADQFSVSISAKIRGFSVSAYDFFTLQTLRSLW